MIELNKILCNIRYEIKLETIKFISIDFDCTNIFFKQNHKEIFKNINGCENVVKWELNAENENLFVNQISYTKFNIEEYEYLDSKIKFNLKLYKPNFLYILNEDAINNYLVTQKFQSILEQVSNLDTKKIILNNYITTIQSDLYISDSCYFFNKLQINISPLYFHKLEMQCSNISLKKYFTACKIILSIIYLVNISSIIDNEIRVKVIGHRSIEFDLKFDLNYDEYNIYYRVYEWIYENKRLVEDRILIFRNLFTHFIKEDSIKLSEQFYTSLLANNENYIKGNIEQYFEIRKSILNEIENYSKSLQSSLSTFSDNFQKNIFLIVTFFISLYLTKMFENESKIGKISHELYIVGIAFIVLSIVYYFFSKSILKIERNNIYQKYDNLKSRYDNLILDIDLNNFTSENKEFKNEIDYFDNKSFILNTLWILCILIMIILLIFLYFKNIN